MSKRRQRGFIIDPYQFASAAETGLLKDYLTSLWGGYSLLKLRSNYGGSAIRVRRSSDDAEQDIGFASGTLDTASLASFVGANDGFVKTWYDQSGAGNDATQATTTKQPRIVIAGTVLDHIAWDGVDDELAAPTNGVSMSQKTVHFSGRVRRGEPAATPLAVIYYSVAGLIFGPAAGGSAPSPWAARLSTLALSSSKHLYAGLMHDNAVYCVAASSAANTAQLFVNGVEETAGATGSPGFGTIPSGASYIGGGNGANYSMTVLRTMLVYNATLHNAATAAAIAALVPPPAATAVPLDGNTTNLFIACAVRKLLTAYAGSCIRVRRSNDNAEADIGFDGNGFLDTAALLTHTGSNNGFIAKWYDQSGSGRDMVMATTTLQPRIVLAGVVDKIENEVGLKFASSRLSCNTATGGTATAMTLYCKAVSTSTGMAYQHGAGATRPMYVFQVGMNDWRVSVETNSGTRQALSYFNGGVSGQILTPRIDTTQATGALQAALVGAGRVYTRVSSGDTGTLPSGALPAATWHHGDNAAGASPWAGYSHQFIVYETAHTNATQDVVSKKLG